MNRFVINLFSRTDRLSAGSSQRFELSLLLKTEAVVDGKEIKLPCAILLINIALLSGMLRHGLLQQMHEKEHVALKPMFLFNVDFEILRRSIDIQSAMLRRTNRNISPVKVVSREATNEASVLIVCLDAFKAITKLSESINNQTLCQC